VNNNFCPAPWNTIYINPVGAIDNCCQSENRLGQLPQDSLTDAIYHSINQEIKTNMIAGNPLSAGCKTCNHNQRSFKVDLTESLMQHHPVEFYQDINNFKLTYLDVRWNNTCNSACVYCGANWSSKWADELGIAQPADPEKTRKLKEFFYDKLADVKIVYLAGGEPLLSKDNEWLLEELYRVNPECTVRVNTNLTRIDTKVFECLTKFKNVEWIISGEAIGEKYEYIRYGSSWDDYTANIRTLTSLVTDPNKVCFQMVYCSLSALTAFDYVKFITDQGILKKQIYMFYVDSGVGGIFDPRFLPSNILQQVKQRLIDEPIGPGEDRFANGVNAILHHLSNPVPVGQRTRTDMIQYLKDIDHRRNTDHRLLFPEIYNNET
jgi:organic radical activating enzyme